MKAEVVKCNDEFYDLAELDSEKRNTAAISLIRKCQNDEEYTSYTVSRLIGGLASSRAAARIGFSNALSFLLQQIHSKWPIKKLFEIADSKLNFLRTGSSADALGHHFLCQAIVLSKQYYQNAGEIVERELAILKKYQDLGMAISHLLCHLTQALSKKRFMRDVWCHVESYASKPLDSIAPEWFIFALDMHKKYPTLLNFEWCESTTSFSPTEKEFPILLELLKQTHSCSKYFFIKVLLSTARDSDNFESVYGQVISKWIYNNDKLEVCNRAFHFADFWFEQDPTPSEVLAMFSSQFVDCMYTAISPSNRQYHAFKPVLKSIVDKLDKSFSEKNWTRSDLLDLLERFDSTDGGDFDGKCREIGHLTEKLITRLDVKGVLNVVEKSANYGEWSIRRLSGAFPSWSAKVAAKVLVRLSDPDLRSETRHRTICDCIDSMFVINVRSGRSVKFHISDDNVRILEKIVEKWKTETSGLCANRSLKILYLVLSIWAFTNPDEADRSFYDSRSAEVITIDLKLRQNSEDYSSAVVVDLLLSVLSRPGRHHRSLVHFVFASLLPLFKSKDVLHVLEIINSSDEEVLGGMDEETTSDEEVVEEEIEEENQSDETKVRKKGRQEDVDVNDGDGDGDVTAENDDDADDSEEGSDEENADNDPAFVGRLRDALGPLAEPAESSASESDENSVATDMSDETMFRLDESISAVFRQHLKKPGRVNKERTDLARQFRAKCFDLLLIAASDDTFQNLAVDLLLPLLDCASQSLRKKENNMVFDKCTSLIAIILKYKKVELSDKKIIKMLDKLVVLSSKMVNAVLRAVAGNVSSYLLSLCYKPETKTASDKVVKKFEGLFSEYMMQTEHKIVGETVTTPIIKYPTAFLEYLTTLLDFVCDSNIRIYHRTEAASCATAFMRKDLVNDEKYGKKFWNRVAVSLGEFMHLCFATLKKNDVKPRFFAYIMRMMLAFAHAASPSQKKILNEKIGADLSSLITDGKLVENDKKMKNVNSSIQYICNRGLVAALSQLERLIT